MAGVTTGKRKGRRILVAAGIVLAVSSAIAMVLVQNPGWIDQLFGLQDPPHFPDDELIANFYEHRADFEKLREMIKQDEGLDRVTLERTLPENPNIGVGPARIAEYRVLLKKVGASGGIAASSDRKTIELVSTRRGFTTHGSEKGYLYVEGSSGKELLTELDRFSLNDEGSGLRRIDGNWYLYFEGY